MPEIMVLHRHIYTRKSYESVAEKVLWSLISDLYMFWTACPTAGIPYRPSASWPYWPWCTPAWPVQPAICEDDRKETDTLEWLLRFRPGRYGNQLLIISQDTFKHSTIIALKNSRRPKIPKVEADIIRNLRGFFACKRRKHGVFRKMIFNMKNPNIRAVRFGAYVDKVSLYSLMYIKSYNRL